MASPLPRGQAAECNSREQAQQVDKSRNSSSGSESSSTEEEERLRRLFHACDRDGDGFIDSHDLLHMCQLLNMEEAVDEIMQQLGVDAHGRISFDDFVRCRMQLMTEIEEERLREQRLDLGSGQLHYNRLRPLIRPGTDSALGGADLSHSVESPATSLYKLLESHQPQLLHHCLENTTSQDVLNLFDVLNSLHLAALTSLKGEIIDLNSRLHHTATQKDILEKQLHKQQVDKVRLQRELEEKLEQQTVRYEDRFTELHSVIAELRKKLDRHQINVIREEDELLFEESDGVRSVDEGSLNENNANGSQSASVAEIGNEINEELSRVVSELETAIKETRGPPCDSSLIVSQLSLHSGDTQEQAVQVGPEEFTEESTQPDKMNSVTAETTRRLRLLEEELSRLKVENRSIQEQRGRQETELNKLRALLGGVREERDCLKSKNGDLISRLQGMEASGSRHGFSSQGSASPVKQTSAGASTNQRMGSNPNLLDQTSPSSPVPKVAGLKKLKTWSAKDQPILGSDITAVGLPNAKVAEHLVQSLQECSDVQEITQSAHQGAVGGEISQAKVREFEIEVERLQSKIDHLKAQNDLTNLSLRESKAQCDRLTVLMGKYESNNTAMQLAVSYSDQSIEAFQVLVSLLDSEVGILLANCKASGIGNYSLGYHTEEEDSSHEDIATLVQKSQQVRRSAENMAKHLLLRLERPGAALAHSQGHSPNPWEELSNSHTTSTTSSTASSVDTEWAKPDEQKLRDTILQLLGERTAVRTTVMSLESIHIDPSAVDATPPAPDAQRLDLENAVLIQELMAMKEEKAELKAQNYLLEKEKVALELEISGQKYKEKAYQIQIQNLRSDLSDHQQRVDQDDKVISSVTMETIKSMELPQIVHTLDQALKREKKLKTRVQELANTLEIMSQNSEYRHQQSAEFVNDLRKANSALIVAFEKAKRKYQAKLKKQETQIQSMAAKYESRLASVMQSANQMKSELSHRAASETSL